MALTFKPILARSGSTVLKGVVETNQGSFNNSLTLNATNGTRATMILSGSGTISDSLKDGERMNVRVINGDTHSLTHPSGTKFVGGVAPTLTGDDRITYEKWGSDLICYAGTASFIEGK